MTRVIATVLGAFAVTLGVLALATRGGGPPASTRPVAPDAPRPGASTADVIKSLQATVRAQPTRSEGYVALAGAYQQEVRETGDLGFFDRAEGLIDRALALDPRDADALTQRGALRASRHDFRGALADAQAARRLEPAVTKPFGVLVDALVELGRYDQAGRALQDMIDRGPDLASLARVAQLRELHGDLPGAIDAMRAAASAGGSVPENDAYTQTMIGNFELQRDRVATARHAYRAALAGRPGHVPALAGLAQVDAATGHLGRAVERLRVVVERLPSTTNVIALAEAELAAGRTAAARRDLGLVRVEQRLAGKAGVENDAEAVLFEADHGDRARAVGLGRSTWAAAPSVRSADALGWALTRAGKPREGLRWARRALELGSHDARLRFHAGMAARGAGDGASARRWLRLALDGRAALGAWRAQTAERALS
jgi:tetratricopeptide (TPR) repeat protein